MNPYTIPRPSFDSIIEITHGQYMSRNTIYQCLLKTTLGGVLRQSI